MLLAIKEKLLETMLRYPSVHNVQPFKVTFEESRIIVYDDPKLTLKIGDPEELDHELSLGAFIENIAISLSSFGLSIQNLAVVNERNDDLRLRARIDIHRGGSPDQLYPYLLKRKCYRGKFQELSLSEKLKELEKLKTLSHLHVLPGTLVEWANAYDNCSYSFSSQPLHMKELYSWLRLSKNHPQYHLDGLNAEALGLNQVESFFGNFLLDPSMYEWMKSFGLGKVLVSEAPQITSSLAVVAISAPDNLGLTDRGRILMRTWLELTKLEIFATPLSALADEPQSRQRIESMLPKNKKLVTVFRVGKTGGIDPYPSPRRKLEKL